MKGYVGLFRMPGYPWIGQEVTNLLETAARAVDSAEVDPMVMARELSDVLEATARLIRDFGAEQLLEQQAFSPVRRAS